MKKDSRNSLFAALDLLLDAVCMVDDQGHFVFVSSACERIFGYTAEEMIGRRMLDFVAPEDLERTQATARAVRSGQIQPHFENRYVHKDGHLVHIMWSARWSEAEQVRIGVARDISARKRAEALQAATYAISEAAHNAQDLLEMFAQVHRIIDQLLPTASFCVALGNDSGDELKFPYCHDTLAAPNLPPPLPEAICQELVASGQPMHRAAEDGYSWLGTPLISESDVMGALLLKSRSHEAASNLDLLQFVSTQVATAIERKRLYQRLQRMARHDDLTGLLNRAFLHDRIEAALARARRQAGCFALIFLDLNKFKQVNDTYGHTVGDHLLQEVAQRLLRCVRESDAVARIGGDEFVLLLENIEQTDSLSRIIDKLREELSQPVLIHGHLLHTIPSIGVAHYPDDGEQIEILLRHADAAMYREKHASQRALREM